MQSHIQRRRQLDVFRPRQPRNDVNAGALPPEGSEQALPGEEASPEERQYHFLKRCARRDLL
jgi:hypothetical protein